jgi:hypothetical protein
MVLPIKIHPHQALCAECRLYNPPPFFGISWLFSLPQRYIYSKTTP